MCVWFKGRIPCPAACYSVYYRADDQSSQWIVIHLLERKKQTLTLTQRWAMYLSRHICGASLILHKKKKDITMLFCWLYVEQFQLLLGKEEKRTFIANCTGIKKKMAKIQYSTEKKNQNESLGSQMSRFVLMFWVKWFDSLKRARIPITALSDFQFIFIPFFFLYFIFRLWLYFLLVNFRFPFLLYNFFPVMHRSRVAAQTLICARRNKPSHVTENRHVLLIIRKGR